MTLMHTLNILNYAFVKGSILAILLKSRSKKSFGLFRVMKLSAKKWMVYHYKWHIIQHLKICLMWLEKTNYSKNQLYADEQVKKVFSPAPFVFFRSTRNLKSYLVKSKIYPLERKVGSEKCNSKPCLVCLIKSLWNGHFKSFQTKGEYKINLLISCNDKCIIYLLSLKVCGLRYFVLPLINLDSSGIIIKRILRKQKEGRSICSHLFLSIFLQLIITVS